MLLFSVGTCFCLFAVEFPSVCWKREVNDKAWPGVMCVLGLWEILIFNNLHFVVLFCGNAVVMLWPQTSE